MVSMRYKRSIVIRVPAAEAFAAYVETTFGNRNDALAQRIRTPTDSTLGQGSSIWQRQIGTEGYSIESTSWITDYEAPSRICIRGESRFAAQQPNKNPGPAARARSSSFTCCCMFTPVGAGTRVNVSADFAFAYPLGWVLEWSYRLTSPFMLTRREKALELALIALKRHLEQETDLPAHRVKFHWRRTRTAWLAYLLVVSLLLGAYTARNALGLSPTMANVVVMALSALLALGFILVLAVNAYLKEL
ncbi:MAG TPA: hypothetical protein VLQ48_10680 [Chloroflexia bacterium]|nr:hypothetical protein [Chloroflexia bacterium]